MPPFSQSEPAMEFFIKYAARNVDITSDIAESGMEIAPGRLLAWSGIENKVLKQWPKAVIHQVSQAQPCPVFLQSRDRNLPCI